MGVRLASRENEEIGDYEVIRLVSERRFRINRAYD